MPCLYHIKKEFMKNLDKYILGETDQSFTCTTKEENQQFAIAMIQQTELYLDILSPDFEPAIYDNDSCYEAIENLALRSRHSQIRILLHDGRKPAQRGHKIIQLAKRLSGLIQFRNIPDIYRNKTDTFLIADRIGIIQRTEAPLKSKVHFKNWPKIKPILKDFNDIWEESEPNPEVRTYII